MLCDAKSSQKCIVSVSKDKKIRCWSKKKYYFNYAKVSMAFITLNRIKYNNRIILLYQ